MATTHDDNVTTWRELADQLTPKQIAELEYCEREKVPPGWASADNFLNSARRMIEENLRQMTHAGIAPPPEAIGEPSPWEDYDDQRDARMYLITTIPVAGTNLTVNVAGWQFDDGTVERYVATWYTTTTGRISRDDESMAADEARRYGAALTEASTIIDRLNGTG